VVTASKHVKIISRKGEQVFFKRIIILLFVFSIPVSGSAEAFQGKSRSLKDPVPMVYLPGGTYVLGAEKGFPDEQPQHEVKLDAFYIDIHEVTVGQYQRYLKETGLKPPSFWLPGVGSLDEPVVGLCWEEAAAYAAWAGKRLPTEAEWEYAARGGTIGLKFPWGNEPDLDYANLDSFGILPVASLKPNGYGLYDMIGNVWEWCSDWYDSGFYSTSSKDNPKGPEEGKHKVLRGWAWNNRKGHATVTKRHKLLPVVKSYFVGFRCVKSVKKK
jgi:formylglycine-generating enzyme required for sulfatase activity